MTPERMAKALGALVPVERILSDAVEMEAYSYDAPFATRLKHYRPDVVVRASSTAEVSEVLRWCYDHEVPVYPRGAATAQSGGSTAVRGGVTIEVSPMKQIIELAAENLQVICEPGVIHSDLNDALKQHRLFFLLTPAALRCAR